MSKKRLLIIGIVIAVVAIAVLLDSMLANHRPAISLEAPQRVLLNGIVQIVCHAEDRDGDELSYKWSASGGNVTGTGATATWIAPPVAGSYNVTVTVTDGRGGVATDYVIITVRANRPPTITSLIANASWTTPARSVQLTCNARDWDGDTLTYVWTATGGNISGDGAVVTWNAPQEVGMYKITVVVKDVHGSSHTRTLFVSVVTGQPPVIEDLVITNERHGHCYLRKRGTEYLVGKEQKYDITAIIADTSGEVFYQWSFDAGEISQISDGGSMITWTAPNTSRKVTITVIVSDIAGNSVAKNIILDVVECAVCIFGRCP